jgi:hypothetical protein
MAGRVAIEFTGDRAASVRGPLYLRPALDFIARVEGPFGLSRVPGALSVEEKRTLVRRLVADGLLEVVG